MPFPNQARIIRWTFPAFALIFTLLWYKRRRIERADPGGKPQANGNTGIVDKLNVNKKETSKAVGIEKSLNIDSGNKSGVSPSSDEIISPKRVSANVDIPSRRNSTQPISFELPADLSKPKSIVNHAHHNNNITMRSNPLPVMEKHESDSKNQESAKVNVTHAVIKEQSDLKERSSSDQRSNGLVNECVANKSETPMTINDHLNLDAIVTEEDHTRTADSTATDGDISKECVNESIDSVNVIIRTEQPRTALTEATKSSASEIPVVVQMQGATMERDSANHSPISGVIEGGSLTDEMRSDEGSSDSGRGGSINGGQRNVQETQEITQYEFRVPQTLVGKLIGRHGSFLQHIHHKTGVDVVVRKTPVSREFKVCQLKGPSDRIPAALEIIKNKFPEKKYANLTEEIVANNVLLEVLTNVPLVPKFNNDVIICHVYAPNHLTLQIKGHPTLNGLIKLDKEMSEWYNNVETPQVPEPIQKGMIVVTKINDKWQRVCIDIPDPHGENTLVSALDYGGAYHVRNEDLRQISSGFTHLPFQANEVYISNIKPKGDYWTPEAYDVVKQLSKCKGAEAQIEGYVDTVPYVRIYFKFGTMIISLADELIERGLAEATTFDALASAVPNSVFVGIDHYP